MLTSTSHQNDGSPHHKTNGYVSSLVCWLFGCLLAFWLFAGLFLLAVGHTRQGLLLVNCDDLADGSSMIAYQQ
jgi:hypothetical protein